MVFFTLLLINYVANLNKFIRLFIMNIRHNSKYKDSMIIEATNN